MNSNLNLNRHDHRVLGKQLELFHFDESAPGMPYWLPKGLRILKELLKLWSQIHEQNGYQEVSAPLINHKSLWEISGHWEHYRENMFLIPGEGQSVYGVKPMNCPNAMVIFNIRPRSHQELPLRLSDCDVLHRAEPSGSLHGLMRVRHIQQDDAHIFLRENQIKEELERVLDLVDVFYKLFGLSYRFRFSGRPKDSIGEAELWCRAENSLKEVLEQKVGSFEVAEGEGAFYGPKIDILMKDSMAREWQMGSIQLDFHLPKRFNCLYQDEKGERHHPVVIHRVIYGSLERFIGILIEHFGGEFPLWLSPLQLRFLPIAERHAAAAQQLQKYFASRNIRCDVDARDKNLGSRIKQGRQEKIPLLVILGDQELEKGVLRVRSRDGEHIELAPFELVQILERRILNHSLGLL